MFSYEQRLAPASQSFAGLFESSRENLYFKETPVRKSLFVFPLVALLIGVAAETPAQDRSVPTYEVTVTNVTRGQQFTPLLVVVHRGSSELFRLGEPAQPGLVTLAEEGNIAPLSELFEADPAVFDVATNGTLLDAGHSATLTVLGHDTRDRITLAAMLIPTNDAFVAVMDLNAPLRGRLLATRAIAYDAGSEQNDELCDSIPGPFFDECGGPGTGSMPGNGEGYVHVHAGIHGVADFAPADRDWRNPVAEVAIRRVR